MIREYINELVLENDIQLKNLEQQLKQLMDDQESLRVLLETMESEANTDKSIFSPRAIDTRQKDRMDEIKRNIDKTKQDIEYVKSFMETHLRTKLEYDKLLAEVDEMCKNASEKYKESNENRNANEGALSETGKTAQISMFLANLYKKTELCLDLLYSDRIKCKAELKNMKTMVRNMEEALKIDN